MARNLEDRVAEILTRYNMLSPGGKVGIAVSGGADSVVLLNVMLRLKYEAVVLHVNHQLRGAESDGDERFVRSLAEELQVPVEVAQRPVERGNVEQAARDLRRSFFFDSMARLNLERVALGHSQSDQAETVLCRLLRGAGLNGLAGMRPVTPEGLIRPLLTVGRGEIRTWAAAQGISWREDSSNESDALTRNRLRLNIMPTLVEQFNPKLECVLADNATVAQAEEDWWNLRIEASFAQITKRTQLGSIFQIAEITCMHAAEQRRFLRRAIKEVKGDLRSVDLQHVEAIREILRTGEGHSRVLIPGVDALRSFETLLLSVPGTLGNLGRHFQVPLTIGQAVELPFSLGSLNVNRVKTKDDICANFKLEDGSDSDFWDLDEDVLLQDFVSGDFRVRNWEPGDEIGRVAGAKPVKLKSLFQEFRILLWERRNWPVIVMGEEVVWSRRFGAAARFTATRDSSNVVRLTYRPPS